MTCYAFRDIITLIIGESNLSQQEELSDVKVDVALIKKDIKQIERFFEKVDQAVDGMADITKSLAVQAQIVENFQTKIEYIGDKLETNARHNLEGRLALKEELDEHKETFRESMLSAMEVAKTQHSDMASVTRREQEERHARTIELIENIAKETSEKIADQEKRLRNIENLKWWLLGAVAVASFIAYNFDLRAIMS